MTTTNDQGEQGFPSDAPEIPTKRVNAKPFGHDKAHALMVREEALRTLTRQQAFDRGYLTVKDLDDEELRYGRCRDLNGNIPPPGKNMRAMIPQDKYDDMVAEHEFRFKEKMRQQLDTMLERMIHIATDDTVEPRDQFEAARYLFERVAGKTPETVNVTVKQAPWEGVLSDISGIGAISRAEHRRLTQEGGGNAGIIDVEVVDGDDVQPNGVPQDGTPTAEQDVVPVHQARPDEPDRDHTTGSQQQEAERPVPTAAHDRAREAGHSDEVQRGQMGTATYRKHVDGSPQFDKDPAAASADREPVPVTPDPVEAYGSRRTENKTYAQQARDAVELAARRKEAKQRVQDAKKQRKIARATGADAIEDEITGATINEDGKLTFE